MAELEAALKDDALQAFARALDDVLAAPEHTSAAAPRASASGAGDVLLAVEAAHRAVFQVLASGAGGRAFYDALGVARLVSVDSATMSAADVLERIGESSAVPVVFVLPPRPTTAKLLADSVRPLEGRRSCSVLWLPAATSECTLEMERQGVAGFVAQRNLSLGLVPIDERVAALCHDAVFGELYVKGDHRALTDVVRSILAVERHTGARIPDVVCHGEFAQRVKRMLEMARKVAAPPRRSSLVPGARGIQKLIVVDRMQDPLSMLLTPMTYEGLLDGLLDVNHGVVSYTPDTARTSSSGGGDDEDGGAVPTGTQTIILSHRDELYRDIRDVNFNILISRMLADIAQDLVSQARISGKAVAPAPTPSASDSGPQSREAAAAFARVTALLKKVPNLVKKKQSLAHHLHLVHKLRDLSNEFALRGCVETEMAILSSSKSVVQDADRFLEEAIVRDPPLQFYDVVKLLCLSSLVRGGLKPEKLLWYRRQLCHTYGYEVMVLLVQLEKLELLSAATPNRKFDFPSARKKFALMRGALEDEDTLAPRDIHFMFPYTGYAPMSVRLVQDTLGIKYKSSALSGILPSSSKSAAPSSTSSISTAGSSSSSGSDLTGMASTSSSDASQQRLEVLVYYVGGVTVAELAAYRFLNHQQTQYTFVIAATSVCNGNRLLRAI